MLTDFVCCFPLPPATVLAVRLRKHSNVRICAHTHVFGGLESCGVVARLAWPTCARRHHRGPITRPGLWASSGRCLTRATTSCASCATTCSAASAQRPLHHPRAAASAARSSSWLKGRRTEARLQRQPRPHPRKGALPPQLRKSHHPQQLTRRPHSRTGLHRLPSTDTLKRKPLRRGTTNLRLVHSSSLHGTDLLPLTLLQQTRHSPQCR